MNCLTYAIGKWASEGGYLMVRRSQLRILFPRPWWHPVHLVPHFLHRSRAHVVTQYVPTEAQKQEHLRGGLWRAWIDLWHFEGHITGDDQPHQPKEQQP